MDVNFYLEKLSAQVTNLGIVIVLEIALFGLLAVYYLYRQAAALRRSADLEEQRNIFLIQSRRNQEKKKIEISDPLLWLSRIISPKLDYPISLVSNTFQVSDLKIAACMSEKGKSVLVTPHRPNDLKRAFKRVSQNRRIMDTGELDAAQSIMKGAKVHHSSLTERDTGNYFDLEIEKAGEQLGLDWEGENELWFYVGVSKNSKE